MFLPGRIWIIHAHIAVKFAGSTTTHWNWQAFQGLVLHLQLFAKERKVPSIKYPYWDLLWSVTLMNNWFKGSRISQMIGNNMWSLPLWCYWKKLRQFLFCRSWCSMTRWSLPNLDSIYFSEWAHYCRMQISLGYDVNAETYKRHL